MINTWLRHPWMKGEHPSDRCPNETRKYSPPPTSRKWPHQFFFQHSEAAIHMQEKKHKVRKSASQVVLARMQLTRNAARRTPHGASRLVHAMSTWSVKTRRTPSRHCSDPRVDGHTTTAIHEVSTPPPLTHKRCEGLWPGILRPYMSTITFLLPFGCCGRA